MPPVYHFRSVRTNDKLQDRLGTHQPPGRSFRGYLHPSGRVTVGLSPKPKVLKADAEYERTRPLVEYVQYERWHYEEGLIKGYDQREKRTSSLGLSDVPNCHKPEGRRHGLKGIPRSGRYRILEGATVLQQRHGKRLGFYTLTCPYTQVEHIYEFNRNFAEITRRFFQELKREYSRVGVTFAYVAAYEIQGERFRETSIPVLHFHWVSPCYLPNSYQFVIGADAIRSIYARVLCSVVAPPPSCDSALDAQVIKKSASGYLAKYLSKGGDEISAVADVAPSQLPRKWWSMSKNVLCAIKRTTIELEEQFCEVLMYGQQSIASLAPFLYYLKHIFIPSPRGETCIGCAATVTSEMAETLRPHSWLSLLDELL